MGMLNWFRPRWKHSDSDIRRAAITEIEDPQILVQMIVADAEWFVRHEALARLRALKPAQTHYHRLMRESGDEEIRRKVVKVMTSEAELERVAEEDRYQYIRDAAKHRLEELHSGIWNDLGE